MQKIEGLYSAYSALIRQKEFDDHLAISVDQLVNEVPEEVDIHSADLNWYINFALKAAAEVSLYNAGYRSVVKGRGLFVNLQNCKNPAYLAKLFNNAKLTEKQKEQVVNMITRKINEVNTPGQMSIDFSTGTIIEDITEEKLIQMLEEDARGGPEA